MHLNFCAYAYNKPHDRSIAWQHHLPWATRILLKLPFVTEPIVKFRNFSIQCAERRRSKGSIVKDLFYHLVSTCHKMLQYIFSCLNR